MSMMDPSDSSTEWEKHRRVIVDAESVIAMTSYRSIPSVETRHVFRTRRFLAISFLGNRIVAKNSMTVVQICSLLVAPSRRHG